MSLHQSAAIECPKCGRQVTMTIWNSVNASISPEAREQLFRGEVNLLACPGCGFKGHFPTHLMYHDMERQFVVWLWPFASIEDEKFLARFDSLGLDRRAEESAQAMAREFSKVGLAPEYLRRPHYVFGMEELVRYVKFRERLFDFHNRTSGN